MALKRHPKWVEEGTLLALETIADQMWSIHVELTAIREKMPNPPHPGLIREGSALVAGA